MQPLAVLYVTAVASTNGASPVVCSAAVTPWIAPQTQRF